MYSSFTMQIIRKIGTIFLVALLIASTGGFSIYRHFCHCAGEVSASVFLEAPCDHETPSAPASCCIAEETHSCCATKPAPVKRAACQDGDCCKTSVLFLKINDSFQPAFEKISLKPFALASALLSYYIPEIYKELPSTNLFNADLPPPDTGRQIIVALHQLKIAPELV